MHSKWNEWSQGVTTIGSSFAISVMSTGHIFTLISSTLCDLSPISLVVLFWLSNSAGSLFLIVEMILDRKNLLKTYKAKITKQQAMTEYKKNFKYSLSWLQSGSSMHISLQFPSPSMNL